MAKTPKRMLATRNPVLGEFIPAIVVTAISLSVKTRAFLYGAPTERCCLHEYTNNGEANENKR